jgi:hypothetical protein
MTDALKTNTGSRLAATLDRKLADAKQPLFDVVDWYHSAYAATRSLNYSDWSANETAAFWFGIEDFKSEAEIGARPPGCS